MPCKDPGLHQLRPPLGALLLICIGAVPGCAADPAPSRSSGPPQGATTDAPSDAARLTGRLRLPGPAGRRGLELHAWFQGSSGLEEQLWILPGSDGRFTSELPGPLTRIALWAGSDVLRLGPADLPRPDETGLVDLGTIDLRDRLAGHTVRISTEGEPRTGVVRSGPWTGLPQRSAEGELPSLGSVQFPPIQLGDDVEWLLPHDARDLYFLVERPTGPGRGLEWRTGQQWLFGPFELDDFPLELILDG